MRAAKIQIVLNLTEATIGLEARRNQTLLKIIIRIPTVITEGQTITTAIVGNSSGDQTRSHLSTFLNIKIP